MENMLPTAEEALTDNTNRLVVCSIFEDERPLKGQAGQLDWKLCGFLSRFLIRGKISGNLSEFVYVPMGGNGSLKHLLLVGLGEKKDGESAEGTPSPTLLKNLVKTVENLKFNEVAVSLSSFPFWTEAKIKSAFSNAKVEFTQ